MFKIYLIYCQVDFLRTNFPFHHIIIKTILLIDQNFLKVLQVEVYIQEEVLGQDVLDQVAVLDLQGVLVEAFF